MHIKTPAFWNTKHSLLSYALIPFSWLYYGISRIRPLIVKSTKVSVPVVCIGNITAGGSGKTPVAIAIAKLLQQQGKEVHFLTRGYGGTITIPTRVDANIHTAHDTGDEPLLLARTAPTWVSRDRIAGANAAISAGADVIVMDDGLQNPALHKDVKILVVDGTYGLGNGRLIPAGPLRERVSDCITVLAVCVGDYSPELADTLNRDIIHARIIPGNINGQSPFHNESPLSNAEEGDEAWDAVAFAGIGHPEKFFHTLEGMGIRIVQRVSFPDHYPYTPADMENLRTLATTHNARLITTEKDFVRLPDNRNILTLPITAELEEEKLMALLQDL